MGGSLLQLVAKGDMDKKFLIGNPINSYFQSVYKKYSNFSTETKRTYFTNDFNFGKKTKISIPKNSDLIIDMYLEFRLPKLVSVETINPNTEQFLSWVDSIGNVLIKNIKLKIGEQIIDEQYGEWNNIWNQYSLNREKKKSYQYMVGKYDFITEETRLGGKIIVPLNFWFCNSKSFIPLVSLQHHTITLEIELRKFSDCWKSNLITLDTNYNYDITDAVLYTENVFLEREERLNLIKKDHSFLIKQIQLNEFSILNNLENVRIPLEFNHPIIEFFWIYQNKNNNKNWFDYFKDNTKTPEEPLVSSQFIFNGLDRTEELSSEYFRLLVPFKRHTAVPDNYIYNYSFSIDPENINPNGVCNFSRIDNPELFIKFVQNIPEGVVRIYAINYNILRIASGMAGLQYSN